VSVTIWYCDGDDGGDEQHGDDNGSDGGLENDNAVVADVIGGGKVFPFVVGWPLVRL